MDRPTGGRPTGEDDAELRRRRREWIREHHPDRGGDPAEFAAGLARFGPAGGSVDPPPRTRPRVTVRRSRNPVRRLRRLLRSIARARSGRTRHLL